jgi:hypothetical protein
MTTPKQIVLGIASIATVKGADHGPARRHHHH